MYRTSVDRRHSDREAWGTLEVRPNAGSASCLAMLLGGYVEIACRRAGVPGLSRGPVWALNGAGRLLDARLPLLATPRPGALIANFHVTATV